MYSRQLAIYNYVKPVTVNPLQSVLVLYELVLYEYLDHYPTPYQNPIPNNHQVISDHFWIPTIMSCNSDQAPVVTRQIQSAPIQFARGT